MSSEAQPGAPRLLPEAQLGRVAGLVEKLVEEDGRVDLARMGSDLVLELDDLLPIVEAAELLDFVAVEEGDLLLTPLGRAYADATILARKAILAGRVLRLPIIAWIYETLQNDNDQRVARDYFEDKLRADFGDRAAKQLDVAIAWGRHSELFAYDDDSEELYLEHLPGERTEQNFALAELYEAWPVLSPRERVEGFRLLPPQDAEDFFLHLNGRDKSQLLSLLPPGERKSWLRLLAPDVALEVVQAFPSEERDGLLALLDDKTRREVRGLMEYAEQHTAGRINPRYVALRPDMTVDEAISFLRRDARDRAQTTYYAYVVDAQERILGTVTFRDLLIAPGDKGVSDVMRTEVVTAPEDLDPQALKELFARYNLQAIPIVDAEKCIKRIATKEEVA
jgi:CBS domain-containing protein